MGQPPVGETLAFRWFSIGGIRVPLEVDLRQELEGGTFASTNSGCSESMSWGLSSIRPGGRFWR